VVFPFASLWLAKPRWFFATATSNRRRCNFLLKTPATPPYPAGTATVCRTAKNFRRDFFGARLCPARCGISLSNIRQSAHLRFSNPLPPITLLRLVCDTAAFRNIRNRGAARASSPRRELWVKVHKEKSSGRSDRKTAPPKTFLPPHPGLDANEHQTHGSRRGLLSFATPWLEQSQHGFWACVAPLIR
jgi:hypothetical protein